MEARTAWLTNTDHVLIGLCLRRVSLLLGCSVTSLPNAATTCIHNSTLDLEPWHRHSKPSAHLSLFVRLHYTSDKT